MQYIVPILGLLLLVAGCADEPTATRAATSAATAPEPVANGTFGSISGNVWTDEEAPIADAQIVLVETNAMVRTDGQGKFTFNDLEPGPYSLLAQRVGYEAAGRKLTVVAGEVAPVTLILKPIKLDEPWVDVFTQTRSMVAGTYVFAYPNDVQTWANSWSLKDDPGALGDLYFEIDWTATTALADGIRFYSGIGTWNSEKPLCNGTGYDPYKCRTSAEALTQDWDCDHRAKGDCRAQWMFRPGGASATQGLVGVWPDDAVTAYISHFYRQGMPADYTALG